MHWLKRHRLATEQTAQTAFLSMMRELVAPGLRELGFKGSRQSYQLPDDDHWIVLGFQKSTSSDAGRIKFTVNLTVVNKQTWAEVRHERSYLGERPSPNVRYGDFVWQERLGFLLDEPRDHWWELTRTADPTPVATEIIAAIRDRALPAIRRQLP